MIFNATRITNTILAIGLALIISLTSISLGVAQDNEPYIRRVPSMESDRTGPLNPIGLAFSSTSESFYVVEDPGQGLAPAVNSDVIAISPLAIRKDLARIAALIEDPLNVVFDDRNGRLLAFQPSTGQLIEVRENPGGNLDRSVVIPHNLGRLGIQEPQGLALDEGGGSLFVLDAAGPRIVRLQLGPGRNFTGGRISVIELASSGLVAPRGIAFDPTTGHLHVLDLADQTLYELAQNGRVITTRSLLPFDLKNPGAMVFAPSGDQTDDPAQISLFLADSGVVTERGAGSGTPGSPQVQDEASISLQSSGEIVELSLVEPAAAAASSFISSLIRTTDMSAISPPGPDPSGIAYLPANSRLMVVDGEVEETAYSITHFEGANVWELTTGGSVLRTANISPVEPTEVPMSDEPTGVAWNSNNGHYYFSDDTGSTDVYDLNPGPDGLVGTGDDTWTGFSTSSYGGGDAEGIAYDTWHDRLFVVDGVNAEVYEYTLTGTLLSQFDVLAYGVVDPEAVEFNPDSGTLFVMSSNSNNPLIIETTTSGALLQTIDISSANARTAAGLAYGPASNGSGAQHFYIVDRGYDNNEMNNPIDGKMYEMSAPSPGATPTASQTFTPTNTPLPVGNAFFASFTGGGTVSGVSFADEDILHFDGQNWSLLFDGSDVGAGSTDLFAMSILDNDTILMAFSSAITLNGLAVTPQDILRFDAASLGSTTTGTFSLYLDGSDVGLAASGEKIDSLSVLPDGRILISTTGDVSVPGAAGKDEDIAVFTPTTLGDNTSGTWAMYFDGSDVALANSSGEDVDGLDVVGGHIYLSTTGDFSVNGVAGTDEDIFVCMPASLGDTTACNYVPALFFDGSLWGFSANDLDGFYLGTANPVPPATSTATSGASPTPTRTPTNTPVPISSFTFTPTHTPTNTPLPGSSPTNTPTSSPSANSYFASFALSDTVNGVSFADEDILSFDGQTWSLWFDGSDVGAGTPDLFAFSVVDADTFLLSFSANVVVGGISATPQDILRFDATSLGSTTAGTFSMYFDGSDVGLDPDLTAEKIDALTVLPDGQILISTVGDPSVPGVTAKDEDLLAFTPNTLGDATSGTWALYFDGSDVGLADTTDEDINALDLVNGNIYLSTTGVFSVNGVAGGGEDVFICSPTALGDLTSCNFAPALFLDGSAWGFSGNDLDGFSFGAQNEVMSQSILPLNIIIPTSTATSTPAPTDLFTATSTSTPTDTPLTELSPASPVTATPTTGSTSTPPEPTITPTAITP